VSEWRQPGWNNLREDYWDEIYVLVVGNDLQFISLAIQRENKILERDEVADQLKADVSLTLGYKGEGQAQNKAWTDVGYDDATVSADLSWKLKPGENSTRLKLEGLDIDILTMESLMSQRELELIGLTRGFQRDSANAEWKVRVATDALNKALAEYLAKSESVRSLLEQQSMQHMAEGVRTEAKLRMQEEDPTQGIQPEDVDRAMAQVQEASLADVDTEVRKQIDSLRRLISAQANATNTYVELERAYTAIEIEAGLL
jgi:hypothetical protein